MNEIILLAIVSAVILCCCIPVGIFSGESRDRRRNVINQIAAQLGANDIANQQQEAVVAIDEGFSSMENVRNL